jgi:hypothetical protein
MTSRDFCYWLQGFFEIKDADRLGISMTDNQVKMIQKHLNLVFKHEIDPSMGDSKHQEELNQIHNSFQFPRTEEEAIIKWGPKPSPEHVFNMHGWYHPAGGQPRC